MVSPHGPGDTVVESPSLEVEHKLWLDGYQRVAGVDEVGRGALAGPLVASAVVLPSHRTDLRAILDQVRDSKQLTASTREELYPVICQTALAVGTGLASPRFIDRYGIVEATRRAMIMALRNLNLQVDYVLIDAVSLPSPGAPQLSLIRGDVQVLSIAAASIVAKVTRDHWMVALDRYYTGYAFACNKGYGTPYHLTALRRLGACPAHRMSFSPLCRYSNSASER